MFAPAAPARNAKCAITPALRFLSSLHYPPVHQSIFFRPHVCAVVRSATVDYLAADFPGGPEDSPPAFGMSGGIGLDFPGNLLL